MDKETLSVQFIPLLSVYLIHCILLSQNESQCTAALIVNALTGLHCRGVGYCAQIEDENEMNGYEINKM